MGSQSPFESRGVCSHHIARIREGLEVSIPF